MSKRKRTSSGSVWMGWSNGNEVHYTPSVSQKVDDYGRMMGVYQTNLEEGFEVHDGTSSVVRNECRCLEYEADRYWLQGHHVKALNEMMWAATRALPDDEPEFEDVNWLDPNETIFWHPNVKEFIRLVHRCREYCQRDNRLWSLYNGSSVDLDYRRYISNLKDFFSED